MTDLTDPDYDNVVQMIGEQLARSEPDLYAEMLAGHLTWTLTGFDEHGYADVEVIRAATGEKVIGAKLHWSDLT